MLEESLLGDIKQKRLISLKKALLDYKKVEKKLDDEASKMRDGNEDLNL